jgi:hypothetical protein
MNEHDEDFLRQARLRAPGQGLDARMDKLFAAPRPQRPGILMRPVRVWHLALACAACAVAAFAAGVLQSAPQPAERMVEVRYVLQPTQQAYDAFDWTRLPKKLQPVSVLKRTSIDLDNET